MTKIKIISHPFQVVLPGGNALLSDIGGELVGELSGDLQYEGYPASFIPSNLS
jgi:hypothetical protein